MTKEDYMKLSKERLAELNVEKDLLLMHNNGYKGNDNYPFPTSNGIPCFAPGGYCTNPQMDCINCPRSMSGGGTFSSTGTSSDLETNLNK